MEKDILLSIIIPVYNAEKYLQKCLDSMVDYIKTYKLQIIAVNDGSIDKSLEILEEYECKYGITVISQKNAGVSAARNAGIIEACGKYLTFVDADDIILNDFWDTLEQWEESIAEMLIYNYLDIDEKDKCIQKVCVIKEISSINDVKKAFLLGHQFNTCWGKVYLTKVIKENRIEFPVDMCVGEDMYWMAKVITKISNIECIDCYSYGYRQNQAGAMVSLRKELNSERINDFAKEIEIKTEIGKQMKWATAIEEGFYQKFADNSVAKINFAIKAIDDFDVLCKQVNDFFNNMTIANLINKSIKCNSINAKRRLICSILLNRFFRKIYLGLKHCSRR